MRPSPALQLVPPSNQTISRRAGVELAGCSAWSAVVRSEVAQPKLPRHLRLSPSHQFFISASLVAYPVCAVSFGGQHVFQQDTQRQWSDWPRVAQSRAAFTWGERDGGGNFNFAHKLPLAQFQIQNPHATSRKYIRLARHAIFYIPTH